jgi:ATP-dependent Clp protease ATP-binding subunit ClpA
MSDPVTIRTAAIVGRDPLTMVPGGPSVAWPPESEWYGDDARRALAEAQREAARLGHNHLGPPHMLVAALTDEMVGMTLRDLGLSHATAQGALERIMGRSEPVAPEDVTLTPRGQNVIERAVHECWRMHHASARAAHVAIAAASQNDGFVPRILASLGTTADAVIATLVARLDTPASYRAAESATATNGPYERFDVDAKRMLALAEQEAREAGDRGINTEYFLLGLARLAEAGSSPADRILSTLGITSADIRAELAKMPRPGKSVEPKDLWLTASAKLVIEHAIDIAGDGTVRPEHLLVAIDRAHDSIAGYILKNLGGTAERVRGLLTDNQKAS